MKLKWVRGKDGSRHIDLRYWVDGREYHLQFRDARTLHQVLMLGKNRAEAGPDSDNIGPAGRREIDLFIEREFRPMRQTLEGYGREKYRIDRVKEFFALNKKRFLDEVRYRDIEDLVLSARGGRAPFKKPLRSSSLNALLTVACGLFKAARQRGHVRLDPAAEIKRIKEHPARKRTLLPSEQSQLLSKAKDWLRDIIVVDLATGMRKGDIRKLLKSDVDLQRGVITLTISKGGKVREIPIFPVAMPILERLLRRPGSPHVFVRPSGKPIKTLDRAFRETVKNAGLVDLRFHDLRRTFVTRFRNAGADPSDVSCMTGQTRVSVERYTTENLDRLRRLGEKMWEMSATPAENQTTELKRGPIEKSVVDVNS
jgi:integrase